MWASPELPPEPWARPTGRGAAFFAASSAVGEAGKKQRNAWAGEAKGGGRGREKRRAADEGERSAGGASPLTVPLSASRSHSLTVLLSTLHLSIHHLQRVRVLGLQLGDGDTLPIHAICPSRRVSVGGMRSVRKQAEKLKRVSDVLGGEGGSRLPH